MLRCICRQRNAPRSTFRRTNDSASTKSGGGRASRSRRSCARRSMRTSRPRRRIRARRCARRSAPSPTSRWPPATSGIVADLLVDTDVFVDHLRGAHQLSASRDALSYSAVTRAELFSGAGSQEQAVSQLLAPFQEIPVDRAVAEAAGRIRRTTGIRLPDALIAATAVTQGRPLVTRNRRDFERVSQLRIRSPR